MLALYQLVAAAGEVIAAPALRLPRFRAHHERLGVYPNEIVERLRNRPVLWLHNASVGELLAARPLLARFRESLARSPAWRCSACRARPKPSASVRSALPPSASE